MEAPLDEAAVRDALRTVVDPELGVSIIDLGLVRAVNVEDANVTIELVLTTPACPLSGWIAAQVRRAVVSMPGAQQVAVRVLAEPWAPGDLDWAGWVR